MDEARQLLMKLLSIYSEPTGADRAPFAVEGRFHHQLRFQKIEKAAAAA